MKLIQCEGRQGRCGNEVLSSKLPAGWSKKGGSVLCPSCSMRDEK